MMRTSLETQNSTTEADMRKKNPEKGPMVAVAALALLLFSGMRRGGSARSGEPLFKDAAGRVVTQEELESMSAAKASTFSPVPPDDPLYYAGGGENTSLPDRPSGSSSSTNSTSSTNSASIMFVQASLNDIWGVLYAGGYSYRLIPDSCASARSHGIAEDGIWGRCTRTALTFVLNIAGSVAPGQSRPPNPPSSGSPSQELIDRYDVYLQALLRGIESVPMTNRLWVNAAAIAADRAGYSRIE